MVFANWNVASIISRETQISAIRGLDAQRSPKYFKIIKIDDPDDPPFLVTEEFKGHAVISDF